jgi:hypothetical protein
MPNVLVAWIGMLLEQLMRHQDKARRAEPALKCTASDKSLLYIRQGSVGVEMLDGCD